MHTGLRHSIHYRMFYKKYKPKEKPLRLAMMLKDRINVDYGLGAGSVLWTGSLETSVEPRALPSNTKGPASFLGVIGPSTPPLGLGVRDAPRLVRECDCSKRDELEESPGTGFLPMISTGGTVAFESSAGCELAELGGDGGSFKLR